MELNDRQRQQVDAIASLIIQPDQASIRQGVELAATLDDQSVFAALADGVKPPLKMAEKRAPHRRYLTLERGAIFDRIADRVEGTEAWLDLAMAHLVAASELPFRTKVRSLALGAPKRQTSNTMPPLWIEGLERFTSLTHLDLQLSHQDRGIDLRPLQRFPSLTHLRLRGPAVPGPLPALEHLEVFDGLQIEFDPEAVFPVLRFIRGRFFNRATLDRSKLPSLTHLEVRGSLRIEGFESLEKLHCHHSDIELPDCQHINYLSVISTAFSAPDLKHVGTLVGIEPGVDISQFESLGGVKLNRVTKFSGGRFPEGTRLLHPKVVLWGPTLTDLGNIGELPGLEALSLLRVLAPISLETLRHATDLRVLDIRNSPGVSDFSPLIGLPNLEAIVVGTSNSHDIPEELSDMIQHNWRPKRRPQPTKDSTSEKA